MHHATALAGHLKVKLAYQTAATTTEAALTLEHLAVPGPYTEEVWVLLPAHKVYTTLHSFLPTLQTLKAAKIVPADATLTGFSIMSPLLHTNVQAYVIPDVQQAG